MSIGGHQPCTERVRGNAATKPRAQTLTADVCASMSALVARPAQASGVAPDANRLLLRGAAPP
jgi:hypothetical protein